MWVFIFRAVKFASQSFFRNFWLSVVTVIILVLTLFSVTMVAGINVITEKTVESVKGKVDISVYFQPTASVDEVKGVQQELEQNNQVKSVSYVSREEALAKFKEKHQDDPAILESLEELSDNPLSSTLIIQANNIDDYENIITFLQTPDNQDLIQDMNYDDNKQVIERLSSLSVKIRNIGLTLSAIFIVIAILIIFNTIRINIYTHREEIGIMKLVGASNWFVRAPFLLEGMLYSFIAMAICLALTYPLLGIIAPQLDDFFAGYDLDLVLYFNTNFWRVVGWQIIYGVALSIISSSIAIGRYLRV